VTWHWKRLVSGRNHQTRNGWLEVGRNSPRESMQRATFSSLAIVAFPRQCNGLAENVRGMNCDDYFTGNGAFVRRKFMLTNGSRKGTLELTVRTATDRKELG
jgi:hypothetical protein